MELNELIKLQGGSYEPPECPYCGETTGMVVDHIVPKSAGGTDDPENLMEICSTCNAAKGSMSVAEFKVWIGKLVDFQTREVSPTDDNVSSTDDT